MSLPSRSSRLAFSRGMLLSDLTYWLGFFRMCSKASMEPSSPMVKQVWDLHLSIRASSTEHAVFEAVARPSPLRAALRSTKTAA